MAARYRNIHRIDEETNRTHCWFVTVQRRGKKYTKRFTDGVYGGKRKALQKAKVWRDEMTARHPPMTKKQYVSIKRKNNRSGVPGVCRYARVSVLSTGEVSERWYWVASWAVAYKRTRQVKFSIDKYGEEGAFKKACALRRQKVRQIEGDFLPVEP